MTEQERKNAPAPQLVREIVGNYLSGVRDVKRTPEGVSTYVYRIETDRGVCFARFLPEDATFGVEVLAQRLLLEKGVPTPEVLLYEPREPVTGRSLMIARQLPGRSLAEEQPENWKEILKEAAASLAVLHTVPVEGFGWVDRESEDALRGEHPTFRRYFTEFLEHDLEALARCGASPEGVREVRNLMEEAVELLDTDRAVLVHGDLSLDHIFHENGHFTGFIDFGEIRGNQPLFDLGDFWQNDGTPGREAAAALLEGYEAVRPLGKAGRRGVVLSALAFDLRFVGRKAGTEAVNLWLERLRAQRALLG